MTGASMLGRRILRWVGGARTILLLGVWMGALGGGCVAQDGVVPGAPVLTDAAGNGGLPDAPLPRGSLETEAGGGEDSALAKTVHAGGPATEVRLRDCPHDQTRSHDCKVHWSHLAMESTIFVTFQNAGNAYTGFYYRYETTHGHWLQRYVASVTGYKYSVWSDGNPFLDDYVAHPMMGAITNAIWIQNDPKSMTVTQENTREYWRKMRRAFIFSTAYSTQWKLGPAGESGVGHAGDHLAYDNGHYRVETGFVSLVTTPVGGLLWTLGEDALDKHLIPKLENLSRNPVALVGYSFLNPARATANILRFRPLWYRDSRVVKATSFWSDPGPGSSAVTEETPGGRWHRRASSSSSGSDSTADASVKRVPVALGTDGDGRPGGKHELGVWWGFSGHSGHIFGFAKNVNYMPIDVRYSYRLCQSEWYTIRYSPEVTALALLDEVNWAPTDGETQRRRTYGSGISPVGLQGTLRPKSRIQPFGGMNGGFIYFADKVLSPQGSQFMYTIDFGAGVDIFRREGLQAVTFGYRYQHLSNANISLHNPGTDANTFYVGASRFRSRVGGRGVGHSLMRAIALP